jgi:hypothetical protein
MLEGQAANGDPTAETSRSDCAEKRVFSPGQAGCSARILLKMAR